MSGSLLAELKVQLAADVGDFQSKFDEAKTGMKSLFRTVEDGSDILQASRDAHDENLGKISDYKAVLEEATTSTSDLFAEMKEGEKTVESVQSRLADYGDEFERLRDLNEDEKTSGLQMVTSLKKLRNEYSKATPVLEARAKLLKEGQKQSDGVRQSATSQGMEIRRVTDLDKKSNAELKKRVKLMKDAKKATDSLTTASKRQGQEIRKLNDAYKDNAKALKGFGSEMSDGAEASEDAESSIGGLPVVLRSLKAGLAGLGVFLVVNKIKSMVTESVALIKTLDEEKKTIAEVVTELQSYNAALDAGDVRNIRALGVAIENARKASKGFGIELASEIAPLVAVITDAKTATDAADKSMFQWVKTIGNAAVGWMPMMLLWKEFGKVGQEMIDEAAPGLEAAQKVAADAAKAATDAAKERKKREGEAAGLKSSLRTPGEVFEQGKENLEKLVFEDLIDATTFQRGLEQLQEDFDDASGKTARLKDEAKALEAVMKRGASIFESTRTPLEAYRAEVADLGALMQKGAINANTHARAIHGARDAYREASGEAQAMRDAVAKAEADFKKLEDAAKSVFESTRTPQEKYNAELKKLNGLLAEGLINQNTFNRAAMNEQNDLADALGIDDAKDDVKELEDQMGEVGGNFKQGKIGLSGIGSIQTSVSANTKGPERTNQLLEDILRATERPNPALAV